jgi:cytidylate kinase
LIVVGFGTQCMFADRVDALHVRLVAPLPVRVERLRARFGWDATNASTRARRMDEDRRRYVQRYFHRDVHDPLLYDVQINTGRMSIDEAAGVIEQLARGETSIGAGTDESRRHGAGAIA